MKTNKTKLNCKGFTHIEIAMSIFVLIGLVGIGAYVYHNENSKKSKSVVLNLKTSSVTKPNTIEKTPATVVQPGTTTSTSSNITAQSSPPSSSSGSSAPATTPTQTPLSALTAIITDLDNGTASANVTASSVTVPGPISNATARPIVFSVNGQTYFAYTQEQEPIFSTSASQTANSMAIVSATVGGPTLTQAHLDKTGILVDENEEAVGYSTGGN